MTDLPPYAISLRQPWAYAMLHLGKTIDNRRWSTRFRGPVLIHASLTWDDEGEDWLRDRGYDPPDELPRGAFVGTMRIVGCSHIDAIREPSPWAFGPWCFGVREAKPLPAPIPASGRLGIYRWQAEPAARPASSPLVLPFDP